MKVHTARAAALLAVVGVLAVACGDDDSDSGSAASTGAPAAEPSAEPEASDAESSEAPEADDAASGLKLTVWHNAGTPEPYINVYRRFAEATGCHEPGDGEVWPETAAAIAGFRSAVGEGPVVRGLAALYAYESMVPEVAAEKIRGLAEHYRIVGSPGTDYFEVHRTLDVEHAASSRELLERHVATEADLAEAERGAAEALDAVNGLLDGICRVHGIRKAA